MARTGGIRRKGKGKQQELWESEPPTKRRKTETLYYQPRSEEEPELEDEDGDDDEDPTSIPTYRLTAFSFFRPDTGSRSKSYKPYKMVPLSVLIDDQDETSDCIGAGEVSPIYENEEDEGLDEDACDEPVVAYVRLGSVFRFWIDYTARNGPMWIQTQKAWYELEEPSPEYADTWNGFFRPHQVAQLVLSAVSEPTTPTYEAFMRRGECRAEELTAAEPHIMAALEDGLDVVPMPLLRDLFPDLTLRWSSASKRSTPDVQAGPVPKTILSRRPKNLDQHVLRPENQTPTHVSPLINEICKDLFTERLHVVGPPPKIKTRSEKQVERVAKDKRRAQLESFIDTAHCDVDNMKFERGEAIVVKDDSSWLRYIKLDGTKYSIGDGIVIPIGEENGSKAPALVQLSDLKDNDEVYKYFWFGRIISIKLDGPPEDDNCTVHVQWFTHASKTGMAELATDPYELFLNLMCGDISCFALAGKLEIKHLASKDVTGFYYQYIYEKTSGKVTHAPLPSATHLLMPPDNCDVCIEKDKQIAQETPTKLPNGGLTLHGHKYHKDDFVLIRSFKDGPCRIGHIRRVDCNKFDVTVHECRRMAEVKVKHTLHPAEMVDERELVMTDEKRVIPVKDLIRPCFVIQSMHGEQSREWTSKHIDHFFINWHCSSISAWNEKRPVPSNSSGGCSQCWSARLKVLSAEDKFIAAHRKNPLRAMELFAGVGGLGAARTDIFEVTHAVEISPSACRTYKRNSPKTTVVNACVNIIFEAMAKGRNKSNAVDEVPTYNGEKVSIQDLPKRGDINLLLAGFPCQPYSTQNMHKKQESSKGNLLLTTLSMIDEDRPNIFVLENVRGFLQTSLIIKKDCKYGAAGSSIKMGGLKVIDRCLTKMDYQFHFGILQAGHYGVPQARKRFILIGSQRGFPLPHLPQPTHHFPVADGLAFKYPPGCDTGSDIQPTLNEPGIAPHAYVSVGDSIGDLREFDWGSILKPRPARPGIALVDCTNRSHWGIAKDDQQYNGPPRTSYQARSRQESTLDSEGARDLQHYTRTFNCRKVEQTIDVALDPDSDYRSIPFELRDWEFLSPSSAIGKKGFRRAYFQRLHNWGVFQTIVCNVAPTAKQSRVLHPTQKRIVSVRELARAQSFPDSFVFESIDNDVGTMHRQIGNAVPPLLAEAIGREIKNALFKQWQAEVGGQDPESAIEIDSD